MEGTELGISSEHISNATLFSEFLTHRECTQEVARANGKWRGLVDALEQHPVRGHDFIDVDQMIVIFQWIVVF
jgi:hypothetical protein